MSIQKKYRIVDEKNFSLIYKRGKKFVTDYYVCFYYSPKPEEIKNDHSSWPKFGIVASKKVGGAVQRNRAKRLMREAVRLSFDKFKKDKTYYVFVCRGPILSVNTDQIIKVLTQTPLHSLNY